MVNTTFTVTAEDEKSARAKLAYGDYDDYECEYDSVDGCGIDTFRLHVNEASYFNIMKGQ